MLFFGSILRGCVWKSNGYVGRKEEGRLARALDPSPRRKSIPLTGGLSSRAGGSSNKFLPFGSWPLPDLCFARWTPEGKAQAWVTAPTTCPSSSATSLGRRRKTTWSRGAWAMGSTCCARAATTWVALPCQWHTTERHITTPSRGSWMAPMPSRVAGPMAVQPSSATTTPRSWMASSASSRSPSTGRQGCSPRLDPLRTWRRTSSENTWNRHGTYRWVAGSPLAGVMKGLIAHRGPGIPHGHPVA